MNFSDQTYNLRIELDTKHCTLAPAEIERLEQALQPLRKPVEKFPVSDLYITIEFFQRSHDYRIKTVLQLPGRGLATGDLDKDYLPAFERCVRKLVHKVIAYEGQLEDEEERSKQLKGTHHEVHPSETIDEAAAEQAVADNDYAAFCRHLVSFEEPLRKRIGRWIQRYPILDEQLGDRFDLNDVVDEVFLNAFERFDQRPRAVPLGTWLEQLIDPSLRILSQDTVDELENISFARSLREADEKG